MSLKVTPVLWISMMRKNYSLESFAKLFKLGWECRKINIANKTGYVSSRAKLSYGLRSGEPCLKWNPNHTLGKFQNLFQLSHFQKALQKGMCYSKTHWIDWIVYQCVIFFWSCDNQVKRKWILFYLFLVLDLIQRSSIWCLLGALNYNCHHPQPAPLPLLYIYCCWLPSALNLVDGYIRKCRMHEIIFFTGRRSVHKLCGYLRICKRDSLIFTN